MRTALLLLAGFGVGLLLVFAFGLRAENTDHEAHEED